MFNCKRKKKNSARKLIKYANKGEKNSMFSEEMFKIKNK